MNINGLYSIILPAAYARLNAASQPYYGKKLEEVSPMGPERDSHWKKLKDRLDVIDGWLAKVESGQVYIAGDSLSFADIILASRLMWMKRVFGEDSQLWKDVSTWNEGRWDRILSTERYETVV
jgi:glutathione S-transferase